MPEFVRTFALGKAQVSIIHIGDIYLPLARYMNVPEEDLVQRDDLYGLGEQMLIPLQFTFIQLLHTSVLIDAGVYDVVSNPEYAIPDYEPPPSLAQRLTEMGIEHGSIEHVVITHRHWDHFNGTTYEKDGKYHIRFPNARHYLSKADWERAESALQDPTSEEYRTLRILNDEGLLELVDGDLDLGNGIEIIAAPGETRGHQIVRIYSEGETLYCLGDLYHHPVEFNHPDWQVSWARPETTAVSRKNLAKRALRDQALLVAGHIQDIGRLVENESDIKWEKAM